MGVSGLALWRSVCEEEVVQRGARGAGGATELAGGGARRGFVL